MTDEMQTPASIPPASSGIADPAPLGLAAFALTTFLLSAKNAHWTDGTDAWLGYAFAYGGFVQLLAGMWEFRNRNVFGATAFSTYGGFWLSVGIFVVLDVVSKTFAGGIAGANLSNGLAWFFVAFAIFNTYMLFWSTRVSAAVFGVFLTLEITEILLAIGNFMEAHGHANSGWIHVGGWAGIITAVVAWYASAAGVINGMSGRPVLPVGSIRIGRMHTRMPRRAEAH